MVALLLKVIHILAAMLFFGTGLGSVFYKFQADRSGDPKVIAWCQRNIVLADWLFTVPSGVVLPVTGIWMALIHRIPLTSGWLFYGILGYTVAGLAWLPAAYLQIRMRDLAVASAESGEALDPAFHRYQRIWLILGAPSFSAAMFTIYLMVMRNAGLALF